MAIQIPSGLRPGPDLPCWAVLQVPPVMLCSTWCSGQTGDVDTPGSGHNCSLCHQNAALPKEQQLNSKSVNCGLCQTVHGWCWPRGRWQCPARNERHMCQAWGRISRCLAPKCLGSWPSLILPLSILLQSQSHWLQTTGLGGRVPQAHPRILTR